MDVLNDSADIFANSSAETVTEISRIDNDHSDVTPSVNKSNIISPDLLSPQPGIPVHSSDTSFVLNQFITESCNLPKRIYCPFCTSDFGFEFLLKGHIKENHAVAFQKILKTEPDDVEYHPCPYCDAKFYVKELLPRHILSKHELSALSIFPSSPGSHIKCLFCHHKVFRRHYKLLLVHIEKKHLTDFEVYLNKKFSKLVSSQDDLRFLDNEMKITTQILTPGLSKDLESLTTDDKVIYARKPIFIKPILKVSTDSDHDQLLESNESTPVVFKDRVSALQAAKNACRKLRFDLPDSPLEEKQSNLKSLNLDTRMKQVFAKKEKRFKWRFNFRKKSISRQDSVSLLSSPKKLTPKKQLSENIYEFDNILRYKCGICAERFNSNGLLVEHIRRKHHSIKTKFRSMYHCGECNAKFFKNSVLVQHCCFHHSPLCLKNKSNRNISPSF